MYSKPKEINNKITSEIIDRLCLVTFLSCNEKYELISLPRASFVFVKRGGVSYSL